MITGWRRARLGIPTLSSNTDNTGTVLGRAMDTKTPPHLPSRSPPPICHTCPRTSSGALCYQRQPRRLPVLPGQAVADMRQRSAGGQ
jgi:hypothetical protein